MTRPVAYTTKVRPGSISEAVSTRLTQDGFHVNSLHPSVDITAQNDLDLVFYGDESVLVNTAGVTAAQGIDQWTMEDLHKIISVNLTGAMAMTSAFVRATAGNGRLKTIVHVGSLWARKTMTNGSPYAASKAGLAHYVTAAAWDLKQQYGEEFSIVGVHPGNVSGTPMTEAVITSLERRGMPEADIRALYDGAITPRGVADVISGVVRKPWLSGENIFLGGGERR